MTLNKQCQTLDFGPFKIRTPRNWKKFNMQGVDSYAGGFTNGNDTLFFDYGMYSQEIDGYESSKHLYGQETINGYTAILQIPKVDGDGSIKLSFPRVTDKDKFSLVGNNIKGTEQVLQIFKSVIFKTSDTNINSTLTLERFKPFSNANGRIVFISNCASCHHKNKIFVGPALTDELLNSRTNEWLYNFFTNRKDLVQDSAYLKRKKEFAGVECAQFPELSKQNIDQLMSYLKGR